MDTKDTDSPRPPHQPETEFTGDLQVFSGLALAPNDPSLEPRERKGRPADQPPGTTGEQQERHQVD